jgi:hypothetical protein
VRLLQLATGESHLLDLHPQVSVMRSLDPEVHEQLVATVAGLARHEASGTGLLEAHGILFDLDPALLSLLDRRVEVDPVIRPADLPGGARVDEAALRAQEATFEEVLARLGAAVEAQQVASSDLEATTASLDEAERALATAVARRAEHEAAAVAHRAEAEEAQRRARVEEQSRAAQAAIAAAERDRASAHLEAAREAVTNAVRRVEEAQATLVRLEAERGALLARHEELRSRLDPEASELLAEAAAALVDAVPPDAPPAAEAPALLVDPAGSEGERGHAAAEELSARLAVIEEVLAELDELDPSPVQAALVEARSPSALVPSPEAADLADQLAALDEQLAGLEASAVAELSADEAAAVSDELAASRAAVAEAEDAARAHLISPEDAIALETAHAALHDALERAGSRVGGIRARGQIDRLRAEEQALLDRLGFVTYAEYLMGTSPAHRDPQAEADLVDARRRLAEAEEAWSEVEARRDVVLAHAQLLDRRRQLTAAAATVLGGPPPPEDLVGQLRAHRVPAEASEDRARDLARALTDAGVDVDAEDLDLDDLAVLADAWLDEAVAAEERQRALREAHDATRAALDAARAEAPSPPTDDEPHPVPAATGGPTDPATPAADPRHDATDGRSDEALAAFEAAQDRWESHETARSALAEHERQLDELGPALAGAEQALADARAALDAAEEDEVAAEAALDRAVETETGPAEALGEPREVPQPAGAGTGAAAGVDDADLRREEEQASHALERARAAHQEALQRSDAAERELAALSERGEEAAAELEQLQELRRSDADAAAPDPAELEWYLVARMASQRSVSVAGSTPLLLEEPFAGLSDSQVRHLLGRLERVAESVQIIVVSDHPALEAWVAEAGEARAALVEPSPA